MQIKVLVLQVPDDVDQCVGHLVLGSDSITTVKSHCIFMLDICIF